MKSFIKLSADYYDELNEKSKRFKLLLVEQVGQGQKEEEVKLLRQISEELAKVNSRMEQMSMEVVQLNKLAKVHSIHT